jgi:hypothetical protein
MTSSLTAATPLSRPASNAALNADRAGRSSQSKTPPVMRQRFGRSRAARARRPTSCNELRPDRSPRVIGDDGAIDATRQQRQPPRRRHLEADKRVSRSSARAVTVVVIVQDQRRPIGRPAQREDGSPVAPIEIDAAIQVAPVKPSVSAAPRLPTGRIPSAWRNRRGHHGRIASPGPRSPRLPPARDPPGSANR